MNKNSLSQYEERINRVITFISNRVGEDLSLDELATIACFSKFHFLRIFKAIVGETVRDFIRRIRIEKAAFHLIYSPSEPITSIALNCGFSTSQNFAKSFKLYYNISPSEFRMRNEKTLLTPNSNPGNIEGTSGNAGESLLSYIDIVDGKAIHLEYDEMVASKVSIKEFDDQSVFYVRRNENYTPEYIGAALGDLYNWCAPRGLIGEKEDVLVIYWDNVAVTPKDKRRFDVAIAASSPIATSQQVHRQSLHGGKYAVYHSEVLRMDFYPHWNAFLKQWFPSSGFVPDDRPCFTRFYDCFNAESGDTVLVDICVPIKKI